MRKILSVPRWLFWNAYYAVCRRPRDLGAWLKEYERCSSPWWKFKPCAWYNEDGKEWEILFENESNYVRRGTIACDLLISQDTGKVVGLDIPLISLERAAISA